MYFRHGNFLLFKNVNKNIIKSKKLKKWKINFSLRNRLFDSITLNNYTKKFLVEIYEVKRLKKEWKSKYKQLTKIFLIGKNLKFKNIDEKGVYNHIPHNPLQ